LARLGGIAADLFGFSSLLVEGRTTAGPLPLRSIQAFDSLVIDKLRVRVAPHEQGHLRFVESHPDADGEDLAGIRQDYGEDLRG
jgi:hypothetical protein